MLGRLKHACAEYMVSSATAANLNDCMLYLSLAVRYQLPSVENKIVDLISNVDTRQLLPCSNFDRTSVASLMLKRAQILETSVNTYKGNMSSVKSLVQNMFKYVRTEMGNELEWTVHEVIERVREIDYEHIHCSGCYRYGCNGLKKAFGAIESNLSRMNVKVSDTFLMLLEQQVCAITQYCTT